MKVIVRYAETGQEFELAISEERAIEEIQEVLYSSVGVQPEFQILLSEDGVSLKDKKSNLQPNAIIYAFSKEAIKKDKLPINLDINPLKNTIGPCLQGEERGVLILERKLHKLAERAIKLTDLISSANEFKYRIEKEINICENSAGVLEIYHNKYIQTQILSYRQLYNRFENHFNATQEELNLFDKNVNKLEQIELHPSLQKPERKCLSDILDLQQLTKWKEQFYSEIIRLQAKFLEVNGGMDQLAENFKINIIQPFIHPDIPELNAASAENAINLYREYRDLSAKYIADGDASAGERLHEEEWESKAKNAENEVAELERNSFMIEQFLNNLKQARKQAADLILAILKQVTTMSIKIRDSVKSQVNMLSSLLKRSEKRLGFVKVPRLLPEAYNASLIEVSRRRLFVKKANELQQQLNKIAEIEISERLNFLNKYRHVLPNDFVSQLSAAPCVRIVSFMNEPDLQLPEIDISIDDFPHMHLYSSESFDEKLSQKYENAVNDLNNLNQEIENYKKREEALRNELENNKDAIAKLTANLKAKEKVIRDTDKGLFDLKEYLKGITKENAVLKQQVAAQTKKALDLANAEQQLQENIQKLQAEIKEKSNEPYIKILQELGISCETPAALKNFVAKLQLDLEFERNKSSSMISFTSFSEGSMALFFPSPEGHFIAFNFNCPNHFLDLDSLAPATLQSLSQQPFLVGNIKEKKIFRALAQNPFSLPRDTEYSLLSIQEMPL
ncbi:unnamed protein product [Blepharisma stoltei]|uniref:Ubiquitin-like domain-containing protein n=1 Tax=Blepharisma stoltei TaxID=1481888 RepID=A0AAU9JR30_9CILI|nr:unnamed protein product [Blepharisma stoltei]